VQQFLPVLIFRQEAVHQVIAQYQKVIIREDVLLACAGLTNRTSVADLIFTNRIKQKSSLIPFVFFRCVFSAEVPFRGFQIF
jgi:hypothetical protein